MYTYIDTYIYIYIHMYIYIYMEKHHPHLPNQHPEPLWTLGGQWEPRRRESQALTADVGGLETRRGLRGVWSHRQPLKSNRSAEKIMI